MKTLLLMSGPDEIFKEAGYSYPKNLIEIQTKPLMQHVIESLEAVFNQSSEVICAVKKSENKISYTGRVVQLLLPKASILDVPDKTAGAACTALLAIEHINTDEPLLIINGDQIIEEDLLKPIQHFQKSNACGTVIFDSVHPRWSYVKIDKNGDVIETAEKRPLSRKATAGFYYYHKSKMFVEAAFSMITKEASVDGKFYICPSFNELILKQYKIITYEISSNTYFSLATPQGIKHYEEYLSRKEG